MVQLIYFSSLKIKQIMKKIFLGITLFFTITTTIFGQSMYLEGGFGMQFTKPDGLNFVVDRYNETRPFLTEEMEHFNNLDGFNYGFLAIVDHLAFEAIYTHRSQTRSAVGIDATNQEVERRLRAVMNGLGLGLGYGLTEDGFSIIFSTRLNTSALRIRTKVGSTDEIGSQDWDEDIYNSLIFDLDFNIKIILKYITIEPYYTFDILPSLNNMAEVNETINPNTFQNDSNELPFQGRGFGLKFLFLLGGEF